jgi:hypothetical protein
MVDEALQSLLKQGGMLGALVALAGYLVSRLHRQLTDVQEKRIADAQQVSTKILDIVADNTGQRDKLIEALTLNTQQLGENQHLIEELKRKLRL